MANIQVKFHSKDNISPTGTTWLVHLSSHVLDGLKQNLNKKFLGWFVLFQNCVLTPSTFQHNHNIVIQSKKRCVNISG